MEKKLKRPKI